MLEGTKVGRSVSKEVYKEAVPGLRTELLLAQESLRSANLPVLIIVAGVEAAGKGEVVNRLNEWLDTRGLRVYAFWDETDEERERPHYWRYWRTLPASGEVSIYFGAWYANAIEKHMEGSWSEDRLEAELHHIVEAEQALTADGMLIIKFWCHLPAEEQKERIKQLERDDRSIWKMRPPKSRFYEHYQQFESLAEKVIRNTDRGSSPWYMIESTDRRYRDLTIGKTLLEAIRSRLETPPMAGVPQTSHAPNLPSDSHAHVSLLDHLDLDKTLSKDKYKKSIEKYQQQLNELAWKLYKRKHSLILVFEGCDAAGKGGAIRRVTEAIDARLYRTIPIAAPTDEEQAHHYLWRFWRHVPRAGCITLYDRSWYGRVLVERVEGFASEEEWRRAYNEINQFEEQLDINGVTVVKFWLQISKEEQLQRFKEREAVPYKRYKITEEDWRNREKWDDYRLAVNEMVIRTSTEYSPWTLVPANNKRYARVLVLKTLCERIRQALKHKE